MNNDRNGAVELLDSLREQGVSDTSILEYIIYNHASGSDAYEMLKDYQDCEM